jgi:hypothetical protein
MRPFQNAMVEERGDGGISNNNKKKSEVLLKRIRFVVQAIRVS